MSTANQHDRRREWWLKPWAGGGYTVRETKPDLEFSDPIHVREVLPGDDDTIRDAAHSLDVCGYSDLADDLRKMIGTLPEGTNGQECVE